MKKVEVVTTDSQETYEKLEVLRRKINEIVDWINEKEELTTK